MTRPKREEARVVVLCEDTNQFHFVRGFLEEKGFRGDKIIARKPSPGAGSAEQWVRKQFPTELKAHRSRNENVLLVVCIDRDLPDRDRQRELVEECRRCEVPSPADGDPLMTLIPSRNIETWLYCIEHETPVNETDDYKRGYANPKPGRLGRKLAGTCRRLPLPPSLQEAQARWIRCCG